MKGVKGKELLLTVGNKIGKLEEITKTIKDNGINIRAICAWVADNKAFFRLVTSDNAKTKAVLQRLGTVNEEEVVIVDMVDESGQLSLLSTRLKDNNIDLKHIYGTASEPGKSVIIIFSSDNNDKALEVIST
jgi:hypothetical protein